MTETQERFLRTIAERVPPERIVELHLFPSLRQGAVESGVAVVAAEPLAVSGERPAVGEDAPTLADESVRLGAACDPTEDVARGAGAAAPLDATAPADARFGSDGGGTGEFHRSPPTAHRFTIYTARYRLAIKGPERGKWEASVSAEADAPLVALEAVVRGVRHRAGEGAEAERLSGEELRAALAAPAWTATT